jgi:tetratricopeptide (TPR) repeat protein
MNTQDFIQLLNDENAVRDVDLKQLDSVLENFPYFQSARMLYLKNLKLNNNFMFNSYLRTTASYVGDRTVLFEYITKESEEFEVKEIVVKPKEVTPEKEEKEEIDVEVTKEEEPKVEEEITETHKVISFSPNDRYSFNEWLQLSNVKEIHRRIDEKIEASGKKDTSSDTGNSKFDLIDKFIETNPRLKPKAKNDVVSGNIALSGTQENEGWMTETLAQVYIEQKKYSKAIKAYKILGLKYPEKSGFFADRIRSIKKLSDY